MHIYKKLALFLSQVQLLFAHGFGPNTHIRRCHDFLILEQIHRNPFDIAIYISTYNCSNQKRSLQKVKIAGKSKTNCYVKILLGEYSYEDILCTPTQEFYVFPGSWVPAYQLKKGDLLLSDCTTWMPIVNIELISQSLPVYALEVDKNHNYFVGKNQILTHNFAIPLGAAIGIGCSFGSGATVGAAAGGFFGPLTCFGSAIIGGLIGLGIKGILDTRHTRSADYGEMIFNPCIFDKNFGSAILHQNAEQRDVEQKKSTLQIPGKPTKEDGFESPKNNDNKKHPHPKTGQYGWKDIKGNWWIPDKSRHGGPHWDVVSPDGKKHKNVYPGGNERS